MILKRNSIYITLIALLTPIIANADLTTINNTNEYSVAYVVSSGNCSGSIGKVTAPNGGKLLSTTAEVKLLCGQTAPCTAQIMMAKNMNDALHCKKGKVTVIDVAEIKNLNNDIVTHPVGAPPTVAPYHIQGWGTNTITLTKG